MAIHADELAITPELVRRLVARDVPELRGYPLRRLGSTGSTNVLFRLGQDHLVRLPRQPGGSTSIDLEARWLPTLARELPVRVPEIVALGEPGFGYPERWSVTRWLAGHRPRPREASDRRASGLGYALANFVLELHAIAVPPAAVADMALRSYRAGPVTAFDDDFRGYLGECRTLTDLPLDLDACVEVWDEALRATARATSAQWVHTDLLGENLLLRQGRLAAVLDFGGLAVGDPSVDLVIAWDVLSLADRRVFRDLVGPDEATWTRARGWAVAIALMTFPYYWRSMPARCAARLAMAEQALADR